MQFTNPAPENIRKLLHKVRSIAVVGLSPNPARPSFRVARGLQSFGYCIISVRPMIAEVLGEKAFPNLESLPVLPDIVESCIKLGIKNLWLQDGIIHEEASAARQKGRH